VLEAARIGLSMEDIASSGERLQMSFPRLFRNVRALCDPSAFSMDL
jgi:hypothetical protein